MSNEKSNRIKGYDIQVGKSFVLPAEQTRVTMSQEKMKKIIAETDAKTQQMVSQAENKAQIIVETANNEATRIIEDSRKKAQADYEMIKQQAYEEGFKKGQEDGLEKFKKDAEAGLKALETLASSSFDMKKNIIDSATRDIAELVAAIADKVCHQSLDLDTLYMITMDAIKALRDKETITIIVSPKLVNNINELVPDFRAAIPNLQSLKVLEDNSLSPDGVIIETPETRLDSRISVQIGEITRKMMTGVADNDLEQE